MDPKKETTRVLQALDKARKGRGRGGAGWLDRKLGSSPGYMSRVLSGKFSLRLEQLFDIINALELEAGEFFAWVFGRQYKLNPDRILRRMEQGISKTDDLIRIDAIIYEQQNAACEQRQPLQQKKKQDELDRLDELRFSYPRSAKEEGLQLLGAALDDVEKSTGCLYHLCDCVSLIGTLEGILHHSTSAAAFFRRAFLLAGILESPSREASLLQKCSYLLANNGQYDTAITLEQQACDIYVFENDLTGIGQTLVDRGNMYYYLENPLLSVRCYLSALAYIPQEMWTYRFQACQCLGFTYLQMGRLEDAQKYAALAAQEHKTRDGINWWKLAWLRGEIALEKSDLSFAEATFRQLSDEFLSQKNHVDATLVSLRLAKVLLVSGKVKEMQQVSSEMLILADALKQEEVIRSTLLEFLKLALAGKVTVDSLDRAYEDIQKITEKRGLASKPG